MPTPLIARYGGTGKAADATVVAEAVAERQMGGVLRQHGRICADAETVFRKEADQPLVRFSVQNGFVRQNGQHRPDSDGRELVFIPSRITRASVLTAFKSCNINAVSNMEASSITNTSNGSGRIWSNAACILGGRSFSSRWTVCRFQFEQMAADGLRLVKTVDCTVQRARHMCRRFARRCGKRDVGKIFVFTANQRQQFGNRCRFARPGPAGNHHKRLQQCQGGGIALPFAARALKPFCEVLPRACRVGADVSAAAKRFISAAKSYSNCHILPKNSLLPSKIKGAADVPTTGASADSASASPPLKRINE